jgi:hypothetical protein
MPDIDGHFGLIASREIAEAISSPPDRFGRTVHIPNGFAQEVAIRPDSRLWQVQL